MAKDPSQGSRVGETAWGILILLGMALVIAHLVWATRIGAAPAANVIDKTFTERGTRR